MQIAQIRIEDGSEEGEYDDYYNYEFCFISDITRVNNPKFAHVDFNGPSRYPEARDEENDFIYDRTDWGIPAKEVTVILIEGENES